MARTIPVKPGQIIYIGYAGENEAEEVVFDVLGWSELYGAGVFQLVVQPPVGVPYIVNVTTGSGTVTWSVTNTDTAVKGVGKAQLCYYVDEILAKSQVWTTKVLESIGTTGEPPDPYETWLSDLQDLAAETQQNAESAAGSKADAETAATNAASSEREAASYSRLAENKAMESSRYAVEARTAKTAAQTAQGKAEDAQAAAESAVAHSPIIDGGTWWTWDASTSAYVDTGVEATGEDGVGVPAGGTTGQVLAKASGTDYDTEWVNQSGGGGTSDYTDLTNKPQIEGVTLSGNKTAADLGLAKATDIPTVPVQSVNSQTGAVVLTASDVGAGTYSKPSGGIPKTDLASAVQTSLGKADTALQSAPVTSVNGNTGAVTISVPSTAADVGAIAAPSSPTSGQFLQWNGSAWVAATVSVVEPAWSLLATVDVSQNAGNIELTNLNNLTEFYFEASGVVNGSTTASQYSLVINNTTVSNNIVSIAKAGTTQYQGTRCKYNGLFWETYFQGATITSGYKNVANLQVPYTYARNVGKCTTLKLGAPATAYQSTAGTIAIYGR